MNTCTKCRHDLLLKAGNKGIYESCIYFFSVLILALKLKNVL